MFMPKTYNTAVK